jgi:hypothetical protein
MGIKVSLRTKYNKCGRWKKKNISLVFVPWEISTYEQDTAGRPKRWDEAMADFSRCRCTNKNIIVKRKKKCVPVITGDENAEWVKDKTRPVGCRGI